MVTVPQSAKSIGSVLRPRRTPTSAAAPAAVTELLAEIAPVQMEPSSKSVRVTWLYGPATSSTDPQLPSLDHLYLKLMGCCQLRSVMFVGPWLRVHITW